MDAVRHRRCRSIVSAPPHGFTLRASPAVKHGVSPPGTVDERARGYSAHLHPRESYMVLQILSLTASPTSILAYRIWPCGYYHSLHRLLPSPRIVYSLADTLHSLHRLTPSPYVVYGLADTLTHCITYHRLRISCMVLQILSLTAGLSHPPPHRAASGGGAPCVTAGDTRAERGGTRGEADSTNLRRRWCRTESVEG